MTVRTLAPKELKRFCFMNDDDWLAPVIAGFWKGEGGVSRREWCFLLEDEGKPVGRVLFYHLPSSPDTLILFGLHLDWEREPGPGGVARRLRR